MKTKPDKTPADMAYERAVAVCNRLIDELDKELERCTALVTTETP